ncbi:MAG TPA: rhodanese-related sulfurtransferase [Paenibacillus sp.]|jgi:UPF0176 protein
MAQEQLPYRVLLYYKFVNIADPAQFTMEHLQYCKDLNVKGRILIAEEGINGTVSGTVEQTDQYIKDMHANPLFADMVFKIDESEGHAFKKIFVRHKQELVTFRYERPLDPNQLSGKRLSPVEFYEELQQEDVVVIDGRNDYEYNIGHFRNAIRPNVDSFREFPEWIRNNLTQYKDKKVLTYCTGGIRCEKLTGFLMNEGFNDVSQLEGGIVTYGKDPEVKGRLFDGKCYVFDERVSVPINRTDEDIIVGKCHHCGTAEDRYIDCTYDNCHLQHVCCEACEKEHRGFCSDQCEETYMALAAQKQ